jgi:hypothetical protein
MVIRVQLPSVHRTMSALPRDEVDMDDMNSRAEDHLENEARYLLLAKEQAAVTRQVPAESGSTSVRATALHGQRIRRSHMSSLITAFTGARSYAARVGCASAMILL